MPTVQAAWFTVHVNLIKAQLAKLAPPHIVVVEVGAVADRADGIATVG